MADGIISKSGITSFGRKTYIDLTDVYAGRNATFKDTANNAVRFGPQRMSRADQSTDAYYFAKQVHTTNPVYVELNLQ